MPQDVYLPVTNSVMVLFYVVTQLTKITCCSISIASQYVMITSSCLLMAIKTWYRMLQINNTLNQALTRFILLQHDCTSMRAAIYMLIFDYIILCKAAFLKPFYPIEWRHIAKTKYIYQHDKEYGKCLFTVYLSHFCCISFLLFMMQSYDVLL